MENDEELLDEELLKMAHELYKRLGGVDSKDARIVCALWERWQLECNLTPRATDGSYCYGKNNHLLKDGELCGECGFPLPLPPKQLQSVDVEPLKKICQDYIDALANNEGYADEDSDHYIFETAMECIFGKDVWKFVDFVKADR